VELDRKKEIFFFFFFFFNVTAPPNTNVAPPLVASHPLGGGSATPTFALSFFKFLIFRFNF
jgi:hypothetical protein